MHWILVYTNTDEIFNHFLCKNVMDFAKKNIDLHDKL